MKSIIFDIQKTDGDARVGSITTSHGVFETPAFMPVATQGSVKTLSPYELKKIGVQILLSNAYHLALRPGIDVIETIGGLHRFMGWEGPILTDSGGFQTFSLGRLHKFSDEGVSFRSHIDGSEHFLTPEMCISYQERLGVDIAMVLDQCPPHELDKTLMRQALNRTHQWAARSKQVDKPDGPAMFGIVQGGLSIALRKESAEFLVPLDFDGYALGGLSVGEPKAEMYEMVQLVHEMLPLNKPRYLMGVGSPEDIVVCIGYGIDMFDSTLPTRVARHGGLLTSLGRLNLLGSRFEMDENPIEDECNCHTCQGFSRAYIHHLFKAREFLAYRLASIHNLSFMGRLIDDIKKAIKEGKFHEFKEEFIAHYRSTNEEVRLMQRRKWVRSYRYKD
jgi:queuine tRNA-ribosyltransferase